MKKIIRFIVRLFVKITGFFAYIIYLKPKFIYVSDKAKKEFKHPKDGAIIVLNHTQILDYYVLMFKLFFKVLHTFVADIVYQMKGLHFLNYCLENIEIYRNGKPNHNALNEASNYLKKRKVILIFPEGKLESKKGKLENFSNSAAYLSMSENKKIIPIYTDGKYGLFKRVHFIVGEPILPDPRKSEKDLDEITNSLKETIKDLKSKLADNLKHKSKTPFTKKFFVMDFVKITSVPVFYFVFPTKKQYLCSKKDIKIALKNNCILAGNHLGYKDPFFMYMHFFSRRIRVIATEQLFKIKHLAYWLKRSGVVEYHRDSMNHIDVQAFKNCIEILNGNGCIGIFPEGHINHCDSEFIDSNIKQGSATMSLLTNSPIIPFLFVKEYRPFKMNKVIIGKPIYPKQYFDNIKNINSEMIEKYNIIICEAFNKMRNVVSKGSK